MPTVRIDPQPRGAWRKWQELDADVYTYSLRFTDADGAQRDQHWSYTPNMTPDQHMIASRCVGLEERIESEGGIFEVARG